jgi:phosphoadenosine phosphosulfate reductase
MLIASHRHTPQDLALWRDHYAADLLHFLSPRRCYEIVQEFAERPCYCSVSWGKDSVVVAAMVAMVAPHVPLVWVRPVGVECPGCDKVRDAFLSAFPGMQYHEPTADADMWLDPNVTNEEAFAPAVAATGTVRRIVGVRAEESGRRRLSMRHHGLATPNVCRPIGWWKNQDVFAYLAQNNLPTHSNYAMLGGGRWRRDKLRVAALGGDTGDQFGRAEWEQEYYGDVLARMRRAKIATSQERSQ